MIHVEHYSERCPFVAGVSFYADELFHVEHSPTSSGLACAAPERCARDWHKWDDIVGLASDGLSPADISCGSQLEGLPALFHVEQLSRPAPSCSAPAGMFHVEQLNERFFVCSACGKWRIGESKECSTQNIVSKPRSCGESGLISAIMPGL